jgi:pimeloyl-ACP methyl ester carboxylesterase
MSVSKNVATWGFRVASVVAPPLAGKAAYVAFCTPPRARAVEASNNRLLQAADRVVVEAPDGRVQAYRWRTEKPSVRGTVLLVHGWTAESIVMGLFVSPLRDQGFDVVALDLPAHGRSSGRMLNMPLGARAILAVADKLGPFAGVITHSFGGAVAALAVEGGSPIYRKMDVDKLVLIASPHSISKQARDFGNGFAFSEQLQSRLGGEVTKAAGRPISAINIGDMLGEVGKPVLVIHDRDDERVPFAEAEALVAGARGHATLLETTGHGHERIVVTSKVVRAAVRFIVSESA